VHAVRCNEKLATPGNTELTEQAKNRSQDMALQQGSVVAEREVGSPHARNNVLTHHN